MKILDPEWGRIKSWEEIWEKRIADNPTAETIALVEKEMEQLEREEEEQWPPPRHRDGRVCVSELPSESENIFDNENCEAW